MAAKSRLIAVATGYNIYRIRDDVFQMNSAQFMAFPPAVVLETLVMQGMAKIVARIKPYDIEYEEGEGEENFEGLYEQGDDEEVAPENPSPEEEKLTGPWYGKTEEEEDA